jgi:hypothetical protein
MPDDTLTRSWKGLTEKVEPPYVAGSVAASPRPPLRPTSHVDSWSAETARAGCRTDRDADALRQAARLATWEDEGGTTSSAILTELRTRPDCETTGD